MRLLRRPTNRFFFWLLYKSGNAAKPGRVPSIKTNGSRKEKRLESTAGRGRPPISAFPSMSWPVLLHVPLLILWPFLVQCTVNIRSGRRRGRMSGHSPLFSALGIIEVDPFFAAVLVRDPISLFLNHSHGSEAFRNGLLSHSQWFC